MEDNTPIPSETDVALSQVSIPIVVEIGRIPITLQKLTELQSGNFLQLPPSDNRVSLIAGGKKLATGELVYIGDALGVRITEITR
jgi:flagellar motor switch protein FliN/FliY